MISSASSNQKRDEVLEALWSAVLSRWEDDAVHATALQHAVAQETLAELAARYRKLLDDPSKRELAQARLDAILAAATALMLSKKTPRSPARPALLNQGTIGIVLMAFALLAMLYFHRR